MIGQSRLRIRLLCLILIGLIVNIAQPTLAAAAPLQCGGCVPYCSSTPDDWCQGCPHNAASCEFFPNCDVVYSLYVNCSPI